MAVGRARLSHGGVLVFGCVALFCAIYVDLVFYRVHALLLGVDTGTYLQTLVNFVHSGSTFNLGEHRPKLTVHDSWTVIVALAPLIAVSPNVETLLTAGVVIVAAAAIPLYAFARSLDLSEYGATALAIAYLLSPAAQGWAFGNFTESAFVPILAFSLALAARKRSLLWTILLAQLLTGVKEDECLFLIMFGLASIRWYDRTLGVAVAGIGGLNFAAYWLLVHVAGYAPHNPPYRMWDPHWLTHLAFLAEQLAPFAFAPLLLGPRLLFGIPFYLEITFNEPWLSEMAHGGSHYTVPLVTIIAIGSAVAASEHPRFLRLVLPCAFLSALLLNTTVLRFGRHEVPPDWTRYCAATRAAADGSGHTYRIEDEGQFAIAAANPKVDFRNEGRKSLVDHPPWWSGTTPPVSSSGAAGCRPSASIPLRGDRTVLPSGQVRAAGVEYQVAYDLRAPALD